MLKNVFKSAVAFSFCFSFTELSIGTRQQGISYNGSRLCDVAVFREQMLNTPPKPNRSNKVQ